MVAESEVPLGTAEPVLFPGAPVVPKGTQCLDHPIFPPLKRWAIFSEHKDAKYDPITPRVFKLSDLPNAPPCLSLIRDIRVIRGKESTPFAVQSPDSSELRPQQSGQSDG